jgi:predicted naringenin-chalcone synthase
MSRLISIGTASPEYPTMQDNILEFMKEAYNEKTANRKLNILFQSSGIQKRYSVLPDFKLSSPRQFFDKTPDVQERMSVFRSKALDLSLHAVNETFSNIREAANSWGITHLITVSCTGIYAPGLDSEMIEMLQIKRNIFHTALNFLGCNAVFPALKIADSIANSDINARILIVSVELCTLHFQARNIDDSLISNTIFGDGAAACLVVSDQTAVENHYAGLHLKGFYSSLLEKGKDLMGWNITPVNFEMILSAQLPTFINDHIRQFLCDAEQSLGLKINQINHFAIHPGGKRILDLIGGNMGLDKGELLHSYAVLSEYGNMSSATILFLLRRIIFQGLKQNEHVFAVGFGPGISMDSIGFTYA